MLRSLYRERTFMYLFFNMKSLYICLWLFTLCAPLFHTNAQNAKLPPLERLVSMHVNNMPLEEFLKELSEEGKFSFAYSPKVLDGAKKVNVNCKNKSVRYILNQVFMGSVSYKSKGNHVILSLVSPSQKPVAQKTPKYFKITGYVVDGSTSARLSEVSIYDGKTLHSTLSDDFGYFSIQLPCHSEDIELKIEKVGYKDSSIVIRQKEFQSIEIAINPNKPMEVVVEVPEDSSTTADTASKVTSVMFSEKDTSQLLPIDRPLNLWLLINKKLKAHIINISDTLFRKTQISLIPGISTNKLISGQVVNDYSYNIFGGYSRGVRKFEVGGFVNIDRGDVGKFQLGGFLNKVGGKVDGFQVAGLMNFVDDTVRGTQVAGFMNFNRGKTYGFQVAGLMNFTDDTLKGTQVAGLINFNKKHVNGAQVGGIANYSHSVDGAQTGGLYNIAMQLNGSQVAGLFNMAIDMNGSQTAGLFNMARDVKGSQLGGLFNVAKRVEGIQVSGLFNIAQKVDGVQLGFLNIMDSAGGIPIGFLSFVKGGYHKLELSTDEVMRYNIAFRTGVRKFYNVFGVSSSLASGDKFAWSYSYGLGTSITLGRKLYLDLDLVCSQINGSSHADHLSLNNKLNISLDWQLAKKFSIAFGPSFNAYVVDDRLFAQSDFYGKLGNGYPVVLYPKADAHINVKSWLGWKIALRFF